MPNSLEVQQQEMEQNVSWMADAVNPEVVYRRRQELPRQLRSISFQQDKNVCAMFEVFREYYLDGNTDSKPQMGNGIEKGTLPATFLARKMSEKLEKPVSIRTVQKTREILKRMLVKNNLSSESFR